MKNNLSKYLAISIIAFGIFLNSCSKEETSNTSDSNKSETTTSTESKAPVDNGKGFGPIKTVDLSDVIDQKLSDEGKKVFEMKCFACHNIDTRKVGPALKGVTNRRKPEWIMNMIMNPAEMTQKDATAKELLGEYMTQMANQNVDEKSARAILEYFRTTDKKK
ncbi:MAG: c-type cytochrome [Candidatus Sericytochromatia bacterium]